MLGQKAKSVDCPAIDGIIDEAEDVTGEVADKDFLDAAIIAAAKRERRRMLWPRHRHRWAHYFSVRFVNLALPRPVPMVNTPQCLRSCT
jgi:hypothetical protein